MKDTMIRMNIELTLEEVNMIIESLNHYHKNAKEYGQYVVSSDFKNLSDKITNIRDNVEVR